MAAKKKTGNSGAQLLRSHDAATIDPRVAAAFAGFAGAPRVRDVDPQGWARFYASDDGLAARIFDDMNASLERSASVADTSAESSHSFHQRFVLDDVEIKASIARTNNRLQALLG